MKKLKECTSKSRQELNEWSFEPSRVGSCTLNCTSKYQLQSYLNAPFLLELPRDFQGIECLLRIIEHFFMFVTKKSQCRLWPSSVLEELLRCETVNPTSVQFTRLSSEALVFLAIQVSLMSKFRIENVIISREKNHRFPT